MQWLRLSPRTAARRRSSARPCATAPRTTKMTHPNSFGSRATLSVAGRDYTVFRLDALSSPSGGNSDRLPVSLKILLENLLRNEDGAFVKRDDVLALANWRVKDRAEKEIAFKTARVLLQDFTGVPAVVDLAAMRDALAKLGGDATLINPLQPVDLVIDHSVQVDGVRRRSETFASFRPIRASCTRSISNISQAAYSRATTMAKRSHTRIHSSEPTRTPR